MKRYGILAIVATAVAMFGLGSFGTAVFADQQTDPIRALEQKARDAAEQAAQETVEPNEINNIKDRRIMNGKAGLQYYVVLLSRSGQPIHYFVTDGKCTSSHKRLIKPYRLVDVHGTNSVLIKAPGADGTYGGSESYIYCKTVDGKYIQWNGRYYASDSPIELTIKPLVISTSGKNQQQQ